MKIHKLFSLLFPRAPRNTHQLHVAAGRARFSIRVVNSPLSSDQIRDCLFGTALFILRCLRKGQVPTTQQESLDVFSPASRSASLNSRR
jgi:hypothetical protein